MKNALMVEEVVEKDEFNNWLEAGLVSKELLDTEESFTEIFINAFKKATQNMGDILITLSIYYDEYGGLDEYVILNPFDKDIHGDIYKKAQSQLIEIEHILDKYDIEHQLLTMSISHTW